MASSITLADIKRSAERKYAPLSVELDNGATVKLLPILKLTKDKRDALTHLGDETEGDDEDVLTVFLSWAFAVADTEDGAAALADAIGDDLTYWKELQTQWVDRTQPGEAKPSES